MRLFHLGLGLVFPLIFWACEPSGPNPVPPPSQITEDALSYEGQKVRLTKHARCRMDCRTIDLGEVQEILTNGQVNLRKTEPQGKPCPTKALEGRTQRDRQKLRIVVGTCEGDYRIVTVIDLENKYECTCD